MRSTPSPLASLLQGICWISPPLVPGSPEALPEREAESGADKLVEKVPRVLPEHEVDPGANRFDELAALPLHR